MQSTSNLSSYITEHVSTSSQVRGARQSNATGTSDSKRGSNGPPTCWTIRSTSRSEEAQADLSRKPLPLEQKRDSVPLFPRTKQSSNLCIQLFKSVQPRSHFFFNTTVSYTRTTVLIFIH